MKKALLSVLVLALLLSFVGTAMAAARPPKAICWQWGVFIDVSVITTKPGGKVVMADGRNKFYAITGEHIAGTDSVPVTGTGHVIGDVFHFSYRGSYWDGAFFWTVDANGFWDVYTGTGTVTYLWSNGATGTVALNPVPCTGGVIPFGQKSSGQ